MKPMMPLPNRSNLVLLLNQAIITTAVVCLVRDVIGMRRID